MTPTVTHRAYPRAEEIRICGGHKENTKNVYIHEGAITSVVLWEPLRRHARSLAEVAGGVTLGTVSQMLPHLARNCPPPAH